MQDTRQRPSRIEPDAAPARASVWYKCRVQPRTRKGTPGEETMRARDCLLLAAVATAAAAPAVAQTVAPAVTPAAGGKQGTVPDFSGIWAHPYLTGFEPPLSGPGPVLNKSRLPNGVANFQRLVGDYTNPILQAPGGRSRQEARRDFAGRRGLSDAEQPVLARRGALRVLGFPRADLPAAGQGHDDLPPRQ